MFSSPFGGEQPKKKHCTPLKMQMTTRALTLQVPCVFAHQRLFNGQGCLKFCKTSNILCSSPTGLLLLPDSFKSWGNTSDNRNVSRFLKLEGKCKVEVGVKKLFRNTYRRLFFLLWFRPSPDKNSHLEYCFQRPKSGHDYTLYLLWLLHDKC